MMTADGVVAVASPGEVIRAKLGPGVTEGWVERSRPERVLSKALASYRVVVVSAMAGAGKTTLVAAVTRQLDWPVAWLTLDWTDHAPGRLVTYVEAALAVAVPRVEGVVRDALAARVPHPEAAGLLVEAAAGQPVVMVMDELERLGEDSEAWPVIEALLRHAPPEMHFVLCSRRPVPASVLPARPGDVFRLGDEVLALTVDEAAGVLAGLGRPAGDAVAAVQATGGWMTGVLFEAWRLGGWAGGGGPDPLYDYLAAHILGRLPRRDREFLIATSVLDEITAAQASALGVRSPGARLASLRRAHIPAARKEGGRALRCHPRFREYLQDCLASWDGERLRSLHVAHGQLLAAEGRDEEATEALLEARAPAEALEPASRAIFGVIDRLDFKLAQRWLDALADVEPDGMSTFVIARLTLAVASENHATGVELADRLAARGKLTEVASSSSAAAWMLVRCYIMVGRYDDMLAVCSLAPRDAGYEALRAYIGAFELDQQFHFPELRGGSLDGVLLPILYHSGHLAKVLEVNETVGWMRAFSQPWLVVALADAGRIREAFDLYEAIRTHRFTNIALEAVVAPRVLTDVGCREEALAAVRRGRQRSRSGPSLIYELLVGVQEARLRLRIDRDPVAALAALDPVDTHPITHRVGFLSPQVDSWYGFALLLAGRDAEAMERLRRSTTTAQRAGRMLELPATAVYLAEAEWRMGNEDAADQAADLALEAARVQGFNHMLLSALRDFPAVLSRRLDAEPAADSPWHQIARALRCHGLNPNAPVRATVQLLEFGRCAILLDGQEVRPKINKAYELLAYLLSRPQHRAERDELLDALFDSRADHSARAYLRQAVRKLRAVLPPDALTTESATIALTDQLAAVSESSELERALAEAARLRGADRLAATLAALEAFDRGPYLPTITSHWADERRQHLCEIATDARYDAAELALATDQSNHAQILIDAVLQAEPYHEAAWRLAMRLASVRGDHQGVLRSYQRCEQLLAKVAAEPTATTRQLVDQLRR